MEQRDYSRLLPLRPPEEAELRQRWKPKEYIIYRSGWYRDGLTEQSVQAVRCTCTACGGTWYAVKWRGAGSAPFGYWNGTEGVQNGKGTRCAECGAEATARHVGSFRDRLCQSTHMMTAGRTGDRFALMGWILQREADKEGRVYESVKPYEAYVFEEKKVVKLTGYTKVITAIHLNGVWTQLKRCVDTWMRTEEIVGFRPEALEGTTAENSKLDLYMQEGRYPVSYLRLWLRHRNAENLLTAGAGAFLEKEIRQSIGSTYGYFTREYMAGVPKCAAVDWKETRPGRMLGLNREELKHLKEMNWTGKELALYKRLRETQGPAKLPEDMNAIRKVGTHLAEEALEQGWPLRRMARYCAKKPGRSIQTLRDYWRLAEQAGIDLRDESLRWPRDLARQHDKAIERAAEARASDTAKKQAKSIAARRAGFERTAAAMRRYNFEHGGMLIRVCETEEELIREGAVLSHCVSTYAGLIAKGESAIFFVRRAEAPEAPWYTLELNPGTLEIRQNRGKKNCAETPEVLAFKALWKSEMLKKKENAA